MSTPNNIQHVFGALQALEKCLANSRKMLKEQKIQPVSVHVALSEQGRVLKQMRRTANDLQLDLAKKDWVSIVRSMRVFYGLASMVRPEVLSTFSALAGGEAGAQFQNANPVYH